MTLWQQNEGPNDGNGMKFDEKKSSMRLVRDFETIGLLFKILHFCNNIWKILWAYIMSWIFSVILLNYSFFDDQNSGTLGISKLAKLFDLKTLDKARNLLEIANQGGAKLGVPTVYLNDKNRPHQYWPIDPIFQSLSF